MCLMEVIGPPFTFGQTVARAVLPVSTDPGPKQDSIVFMAAYGPVDRTNQLPNGVRYREAFVWYDPEPDEYWGIFRIKGTNKTETLLSEMDIGGPVWVEESGVVIGLINNFDGTGNGVRSAINIARFREYIDEMRRKLHGY